MILDLNNLGLHKMLENFQRHQYNLTGKELTHSIDFITTLTEIGIIKQQAQQQALKNKPKAIQNLINKGCADYEHLSYNANVMVKAHFKETNRINTLKNIKPHKYKGRRRGVKQHTPEAKANMSAKHKANWANPEWRAKRIAQMKESNTGFFSKAHAQESAKRLKSKWDDPTWRAMMTKKQSEGAKKKWADPAKREAAIAQQKAGIERRKNEK